MLGNTGGIITRGLNRNGWGANLCLLCALALLFSGCTDVGPIKTAADFSQAMQASVNLNDEAIQQYGRALWFPGADAYGFGPWEGIQEPNDGVLVLLETRLIFVKWNVDAKRYEIQREIKYADARDVRRRVWAANQRIVLETVNGRTDAFTLTADNGQTVSLPRINRAIAFLRTKIPSSDAGSASD